MPVSTKFGRDLIKDWINKQTDIKTIVDLGPGSGTYAKLLGNKYIWKAVEIWAPSIKKYKLNSLYSEIRIGDMQYMELPDGDLCISGSCLEHLPKPAAIRTFNKIDKQFKHVILKIPVMSNSKDVINGNWFESHLSVWSLEELEKLVPPTYKIRKLYQNRTPMVFIK